MPERRIAIVGFGFSGLMVAANLARHAPAGTTIYIVTALLDPVGIAYSTKNPHHLLNVPAAKMGAFPEAVEGFFDWLQTADAALSKQRLGIQKIYAATDFVPRALYGAYLRSIWAQAQTTAAQRQLAIRLVESEAVAITPGGPLTLLTARGDAIAVDRIVLATGNETKPVYPHLPPAALIQNPWKPGAFDEAGHWSSPVALIGAGLTAVDTILSLRDAGYEGEIIAISRNGLLPRVHAPIETIFTYKKEELAAHSSLVPLMRFIRHSSAEHGEWRAVIDALRPHTSWLWQRLTAPDRQRFLTRLSTVWNVHRHRMAPEIAARIDTEIASGRVHILAGKRILVRMENERLQIQIGADAPFYPSRIVNCTGPEMNLARSAQPLFKHALAHGVLEPHATHLGIAADPEQRAWGAAYPNLYVMGSLLTGQLLESTAVPELRAQANQVVAAILA